MRIIFVYKMLLVTIKWWLPDIDMILKIIVIYCITSILYYNVK